ncbi:MAG: hypothetical protein ABW026_11795, partial [Microvirga sp.]
QPSPRLGSRRAMGARPEHGPGRILILATPTGAEAALAEATELIGTRPGTINLTVLSQIPRLLFSFALSSGLSPARLEDDTLSNFEAGIRSMVARAPDHVGVSYSILPDHELARVLELLDERTYDLVILSLSPFSFLRRRLVRSLDRRGWTLDGKVGFPPALTPAGP